MELESDYSAISSRFTNRDAEVQQQEIINEEVRITVALDCRREAGTLARARAPNDWAALAAWGHELTAMATQLLIATESLHAAAQLACSSAKFTRAESISIRASLPVVHVLARAQRRRSSGRTGVIREFRDHYLLPDWPLKSLTRRRNR